MMLSNDELRNKLMLLLSSLKGLDLDLLEEALSEKDNLAGLDLLLLERLSEANILGLLRLVDDLKAGLVQLSASRTPVASRL